MEFFNRTDLQQLHSSALNSKCEFSEIDFHRFKLQICKVKIWKFGEDKMLITGRDLTSGS